MSQVCPHINNDELLAGRSLCRNFDVFSLSHGFIHIQYSTNTPTTVALGTSCRSSSNRLPASCPARKSNTPVTLPPGLLRLATNPS